METLPEQKPPARSRRRLLFWLPLSAAALLLLLGAALLLAPQFISTPAVKKKIQQIVAEKTGAEVNWQEIGLSWFPSPVITLQQITLDLPGRAQGLVAEFRLSPELLPLLTGKLHVARLDLEQPEISLELPAPIAAEAQAPAKPGAGLEETLNRLVPLLARLVPDLDLVVRHGRLSVAAQGEKLVEADAIDLQLDLSVAGPRSGRAELKGEAAELGIRRNGRRETFRRAELDGSVEMAGSEIKVLLERLTLAEPGLELSGNLTTAPREPTITLSIAGKNIDVDATRRFALALAGDIPIIRNIFDHLRGGKVPQITFKSQGKAAADLGDLKNIRIAGKLQQGAVSIPPIKLDLTEVVADVLIAEGVLEGSGMSARLEGSTGHDGTLKVGLAKGNDLFQLELMLNADLTQAKRILERIVKNPAFNRELDQISRMEGTGIGKLMLGDSLHRIHARVDVTKLNFTADYRRVPFPIAVTDGKVEFSPERVRLEDWNGSIGRSNFNGLGARFNLEEAVTFEVSAGVTVLSLDELVPWLTSFGEGVASKKIGKVGGWLDLSRLSFSGPLDQPQQWQFAAAGAVRDLQLSASRLPAPVSLARGSFALDGDQLTVENLAAKTLDADLTLTGTAGGVPKSLDRVEATADGTLGKDAVAWLEETFEVPAAWRIRPPVTLSAFRVDWRPGAETSCAGDLALRDGPELTVDATFRPGQVEVRKLNVKDRQSDAELTMAHGPGGRSLGFSGTLQSETLGALFVDPASVKGRLEGDFSVRTPEKKLDGLSARGSLKGSQLRFPLPSGDQVAIDQATLTGEETRLAADLKSLEWKGLTWRPLKAVVEFTQGETRIRVAEGQLCGIDSPGVLTIGGKDIALDFTLDGKGLDLTTSYSCLTQGKVRMTGALDFSSRISAQGQAGELLRKMQGPLEMTFANGVIKQGKLLARILEVLNVTEIVKGRLPDLGSTGFAYSTITLQGEFGSGKLRIEKLYMDGETLDILGHGEIDMEQKTVNIELLAAPFKTADTVVRNIPGVNYLLAGSLVAIPVSIKGKLDDPTVRVMSASSVGSSLLKLGERTIKSPLKLIETLMPGGKPKDK